VKRVKTMINVTERAKKELKRLLINNVDWPGARLRLMDRGQGKLGLGIDIEAPEDHVIEYEGTKLLLVEPRLATSLRQITLDVDDTPDGPELVISEEIVKQSVVSGTENWVPLPPASYSRN
jgi:Fe-S cluster assembly iron-binding protein IscA